MKLTPEQKASFEYGFEKGRLRMAIDTIRRRAWERHGARYGEVVFPVRELVWNEFNIKGIIACVRQKRAACRAWQVKERYCGNCKYSDYSEWDVPCCECSHANIVESIDRWEPRKEAS